MKFITTARMRELDEKAIREYGIPSLLLMENAGRGIADLVVRMNPKFLPLLRGKVRMGGRIHHLPPASILPRKGGGGVNILVLSGKGNNGGDGFAAARHLWNRGYRVNAALLGNAAELKSDPRINFNILRKMRVPIEIISSVKKFPGLQTLIRNSDLIVDAIFGVGLTRPVGGLHFDVISIVNDSKKRVLAIDIPSGLNSDTGEAMGIAVRADATGTLGAVKRGLVTGSGPAYAGKVHVLDISIPRNLLR